MRIPAGREVRPAGGVGARVVVWVFGSCLGLGQGQGAGVASWCDGGCDAGQVMLGGARKLLLYVGSAARGALILHLSWVEPHTGTGVDYWTCVLPNLVADLGNGLTLEESWRIMAPAKHRSGRVFSVGCERTA